MEEYLNPMPDILGMSLYQSFNLLDLSKIQMIELLTFHDERINEHSISSIDCFCEKCGKLTTFKSRNTSKEVLKIVGLKSQSCEWLNPISDEWSFDFDSFLTTLQEIEIFIRSFYCPRAPQDNTHDISIVFRITLDRLTKIGQYPQLADLENTHLKKYKDLDKEIYQELNRAVGLNSHGIGVGSFVYLRRIIEKYVVYPELERLIEEKVLKTEQISLADFKGKVALAKDHLPSVLVENARIYSILSKGIHSLSEKECLEIFNPLLTAIELILDERMEKIEKEKKLKKMKDDLNKIN
jgi:hypothetical protein